MRMDVSATRLAFGLRAFGMAGVAGQEGRTGARHGWRRARIDTPRFHHHCTTLAITHAIRLPAVARRARTLTPASLRWRYCAAPAARCLIARLTHAAATRCLLGAQRRLFPPLRCCCRLQLFRLLPVYAHCYAFYIYYAFFARRAPLLCCLRAQRAYFTAHAAALYAAARCRAAPHHCSSSITTCCYFLSLGRQRLLSAANGDA